MPTSSPYARLTPSYIFVLFKMRHVRVCAHKVVWTTFRHARNVCHRKTHSMPPGTAATTPKLNAHTCNSGGNIIIYRFALAATAAAAARAWDLNIHM